MVIEPKNNNLLDEYVPFPEIFYKTQYFKISINLTPTFYFVEN